jgi:glycosyltransferase involved in cell wall biosynthesis
MPNFEVVDVLLVSKPLAPPWNDGAKNLVRDLVAHAEGKYRYRCLVTADAPPLGEHAITEKIYPDAGSYAPSLANNARVFARLLKPDNSPIYHFFFAPNPKTNRAAATVLRIKKRRVVHTVVSEPNGAGPWFADVHVALTRHTQSTLRELGAPDVRCIPPAVRNRSVPTPSEQQAAREAYGLPTDGTPIVLFAGDLVENGGAVRLADAAKQLKTARFVFACRPKGRDHAQMKRTLQAELGDTVHWLGEVADMQRLIDAVDIHCLPATHLAGKMDLPMVLLEGMRNAAPVVILDVPPILELGGDDNGVICVDPTHPTALVNALRRLTDDSEYRSTMGQAARKRVLTAYSPDRMVHAYESLYDEVMGSKP